MRSPVYILIIILLISGCASQKRCLKKFPPEIIHDTVHSAGVVFFDDTTVLVTIPGDTAYIESPWSDDIIWTDDFTSIALGEITVEHNIERIRADVPLAYSWAWVESNTLKMQLIQKDSILQIKLDSVRQMSVDTLRIEVKEYVTVPDDDAIHTIYKPAFFFALFLIVFLTVLIIIFFRIK